MKRRLSESGFSLVEMLVATALTGLVITAGMVSWNYFNKTATKELENAGNMGEFNQLTKDLAKFTEGGGISTAYLNMPVELGRCDFDTARGVPTRPCMAKVQGAGFQEPSADEIPEKLKKQTCSQFYKDGIGNISSRRAFPGTTNNDQLNHMADMEVKTNESDLQVVWPLIDETSTPFLMLKMQTGGIYLTLLKGPTEVSRSYNTSSSGPNEEYSFFEYPVNSPDNTSAIDNVLGLKGQAFLVYNMYYPNHFTIQYVEDIQHCASFNCLEKLKKLGKVTTFTRDGFPTEDKALTEDLQTLYPTNAFALKLKPIDLSTPFFKNIVDTQGLPENCLSTWDINKQNEKEYFFPSKAFSIFSSDATKTDDIGGPDPLNVLHLNHYYTASLPMTTSAMIKKGLMVAMPINIGVYKVITNGASGEGKKLSLVLSKWRHDKPDATDWQVRIADLKGPFLITRRVGTSEMGIMYNPNNDRPVAKK